MYKYNVYIINENGIPKKHMHIHAHNIDSAWMGAKSWFYKGLFLITNIDKAEAKIFILER